MADEPFGRQGEWPEQKPAIGTGEGEIPLAGPMPPKIDIRTMATDEKSVQEGGSAAPHPYTPPPTSPKLNEPETTVFKPPQIDSTPTPPPPIPADLKKIKTKPKKGPVVFIVVLILIIAAGLAGYFVIYPAFFKPQPPTPPAPPPPPPPPPPIPICGDGICDITEDASTCAIDCEPLPPPPPPGPTHNSLFKSPADLTENINLETPSLTAFKQRFDFTTAETAILKEVILRNQAGELIGLNDFVKLVLPNVFTDEVANNFESDATIFIYSNNKGAWPGFAVKLKADVATANLESDLSKKIIENPADAQNLFLAAPGEPQTWKVGQTNGVSNNYLTFSNPNFAINFAWVQDKLLFTASYDAFKETLRRLQ